MQITPELDGVKAIVSDGKATCQATFSANALRIFEEKHHCLVSQKQGSIVILQSFAILVKRSGPIASRISLFVEQVRLMGGTGGPTFGNPQTWNAESRLLDLVRELTISHHRATDTASRIPAPDSANSSDSSKSIPVLPQDKKANKGLGTTSGLKAEENSAGKPANDRTARDGTSPWVKVGIRRSLTRVPKDQQELLGRSDSWYPPEPGQRFPFANIPLQVQRSLTKNFQARAQLAETVKDDTGTASDDDAEAYVDDHDEDADSDVVSISELSDSSDAPFPSAEWPESSPRDRASELPPDSSAPGSATAASARTHSPIETEQTPSQHKLSLGSKQLHSPPQHIPPLRLSQKQFSAHQEAPFALEEPDPEAASSQIVEPTPDPKPQGMLIQRSPELQRESIQSQQSRISQKDPSQIQQSSAPSETVSQNQQPQNSHNSYPHSQQLPTLQGVSPSSHLQPTPQTSSAHIQPTPLSAPDKQPASKPHSSSLLQRFKNASERKKRKMSSSLEPSSDESEDNAHRDRRDKVLRSEKYSKTNLPGNPSHESPSLDPRPSITVPCTSSSNVLETPARAPSAQSRAADTPLPMPAQVQPDVGADIFECFTKTYSEYGGDRGHFYGRCRRLDILYKEDKGLPVVYWDDYIIRHRTEYKPYYAEMEDLGEDPLPDHKWYVTEIEPRKRQKILIPQTLKVALEQAGRRHSSAMTALRVETLSTPQIGSRPPGRHINSLDSTKNEHPISRSMPNSAATTGSGMWIDDDLDNESSKSIDKDLRYLSYTLQNFQK
jgi:hypothetical protein